MDDETRTHHALTRALAEARAEIERLTRMVESIIATAEHIAIEANSADAHVARLREAGDRLSFAAQTTGGTAGRDDDLVAAIDGWSTARAALAETAPAGTEGGE